MSVFERTACERLLGLCGVCLLLIAAIIGGGVAMNLMGISRLVDFGGAYWLIGRGVSFNTLMGLQILLFSMAVMLAIAPVLLLDRHVRVDILYGRWSARTKRAVDVVGHLVFALPFFGLLLLPAYRFAERSYRISERSVDGGLSDIYVIKALLPLGIALFLAAVLYLLARDVATLVTGGAVEAREVKDGD